MQRVILSALGLGLGALCPPPALAQVQIHELMASNRTAYPDVTDFEDYPDWIELRNTSATTANLGGYFLSDDPADPHKWPLPATASIPANGFLLVMADGHDASVGEVHPRGYWPWRDFATEKLHTNFSLGADGESVVLTRATGLTTTDLITAAYPAPTAPATAAVWRFKDDGSDQSTQWRARVFDDSGWGSGPARLGYGDAPATVVSYGPSSTNKFITTYFRHTFQVADPASIHGMTLRLLVDDGAVVYLNGTEVVRRNMPATEVDFSTLALDGVGGADETTRFYSYHIPATGLVAGDNVIAIEVHQADEGSSDLGFDLGLTGSSHASSTTVDSVSFGQQLPDISHGRNPANPDLWQSCAQATPGGVNSPAAVDDLRIDGNAVAISPPAGFYTAPQSATLSTTAGQIRYTLDGSIPGTSAPLYGGPLTLSATTVLRARVFEPGKTPGPVETRTYFLGETQGTVPYVSLVADPDTLFGDEIGIYTNQHEPVDGSYGLHNVYKGKEAPASAEFFAPGGAPGFRIAGGIKIGGENNWVHPQKALNFAVDGGEAISYDLFPGTRVPTHTAFTLRDGGDNWNKDMLRDGMAAGIINGRMALDAAPYRPVIVFINGAYFGIHDLRVRWDDTWFQQKHRTSADGVDHLHYGHVSSSTTTLGVEKGTADDWLDLLDFLETADLTTPANWAFVETRIDVDSFIDFVVYEAYSLNTSWHHNREFWKERKPGAKWRWFITDVDRTFDTASRNSNILRAMLGSDEVLDRLKANPGFIARLAQRFAAHNASTFKPSRLHAIVSQMDSEITAEVPRHVARWAPDGTTVGIRAAQIQEIKEYATEREPRVYTELAAELNLDPPVNLTLAVANPAAGRILVDGVAVEPGVVRLFPDLPFDLEAKPSPGYTFTGWTGGATGTGPVVVTLTGPRSITANFSPSGETVVGGTLASNTALSSAGSPYVLTGDLVVPPNVTLTVAAGVTLRMPALHHLRVQGGLRIEGTAAAPVRIVGRDGARWGGISLENPTDPCALGHLIIRDATRGFDPLRFPSAIAGLNATLVMDFIDIDGSEAPVFVRGGSTILRDSRLHTPLTGDCINVKQGAAEIRRCVFLGNNAPDTDAIDYDGVVGGSVQDSFIYRFQGPNSDGIDIGEECANVILEGNKIYFNSDKGVSVGQASTVTIRRNLIVGCNLGVAVKDTGSVATLDQNTLVANQVGIAAYEKNFGQGGGVAVARNTILASNAIAPTTQDAFSSVTVDYSLCDTAGMAGTGNLLADPLFLSPASLNYQLAPGSPAIDAADPAHAPDEDATRADIGARYVFSPADYPFTVGETVVINEVLANSGAATDWIELHNRTATPVDIGGWFLSDDGSDLRKFRIAAGTVIPAGGHVVFHEHTDFGVASIAPGRITGFALSDVGETVYLSSAANDELTDYQSKEDFGASNEGESLGSYYKPSTDSYNFVAMESPTPGAANSGPRIGPIVISEIMYHPAGDGDAEFLELLNLSNAPVTLYDAAKSRAWRITDGIEHEFPAAPPLTMAPGERIVLTKNLELFHAAFGDATGARVFEWTSGKLDNSGETVQLGQPGGVDALNVRQFVRIDRVVFGDAVPWPSAPDGGGSSLARVVENAYGNDVSNWAATPPSPGSPTPTGSYGAWAAGAGLAGEQALGGADPDNDGMVNLVEYAFGLDPAGAEPPIGPSLRIVGGQASLEFPFDPSHTDIEYFLEASPTLDDGSWQRVDSTATTTGDGRHLRMATHPTGDSPLRFYRLRVAIQLPF